jgi:hypothetical protein
MREKRKEAMTVTMRMFLDKESTPIMVQIGRR